MYDKIPGHSFETYGKSQFIKKFGISVYVPREQAGLTPYRLMRSLMYKNKELRTTEFQHVTTTTFESDPPNKPPGKRSRIGDIIMLFDSKELAEKLRPYPEDHKFPLNRNFTVTLKGGIRSDNQVPNFFSSTMTTNILQSAKAAGYKPTDNV